MCVCVISEESLLLVKNPSSCVLSCDYFSRIFFTCVLFHLYPLRKILLHVTALTKHHPKQLTFLKLPLQVEHLDLANMGTSVW